MTVDHPTLQYYGGPLDGAVVPLVRRHDPEITTPAISCPGYAHLYRIGLAWNGQRAMTYRGLVQAEQVS